MTRILLEQAAAILNKHHMQQTRYSRAKQAANATCADFKDNPIAGLAESAYMHGIGKETEALLEAIREYLAQPEPACAHTWSEEGAPFWRSHCAKCGLKAQGSGQ